MPVIAWVILAASLLLTVGAYSVAENHVRQRTRERFDLQAENLAAELRDRLLVYEQVLWGGVGLFNASQRVERTEFRQYLETLDIEKHWPGIQGVGFAVPVTDVAAHEAEVRAEGFPDYAIQPAAPRDEYTAIVYLEPFDWRNQRAFGYDMWSNEMRRAAMRRARDEGVATTSGKITLVQETESDVQAGFLTYVPVYTAGPAPASTPERISRFVGWVYAAFRAGDLMDHVVQRGETSLSFEVYDGATVGRPHLLYDSDSSLIADNTEFTPECMRDIPLRLQGRDWVLRVHTPPDLMIEGEYQPMWIALAGSIISFLAFYVILSLHSVKQRAEDLAAAMTVELQHSNERLTDANRILEIRIDGLEQFTHVASHDLQEPLRKLIMFASTLRNDLDGDLSEDALSSLEGIDRSSRRMRELIHDLLELSRATNRPLELRDAALDQCLDRALGSLDQTMDELDIAFDRAPLPRMRIDPTLVAQVFQNLLTNAIKFGRSATHQQISVTCETIDGQLVFGVRDNGTGIPVEYRDLVFEPFRRLNPKGDTQGSGIGLAIVARAVERHGGRVWIESVESGGTHIRFTLDAASLARREDAVPASQSP